MRSTGALLLGGMLLFACAESVEQPIPFNHRLHVEKNELACDFCHETVTQKPFAGFPSTEICMGCHEGDVTTTEAGAKNVEIIRAHAKEGKELPWKNLYELPAHVYYSHRRHVKIAGLECKTCHGEIARAERPPTEPVAETLLMDTCVGCHEKKGADIDCVACHR